MGKIIYTFVLVMMVIVFFYGCTENERVRVYGGSQEIILKCDEKLVNVTWKGTDLWYLTRMMRPGEKAEIHTFKENSTWGMMEGIVAFKECKTDGYIK